jgi:DMSO reductase anchor subunit
VVAALRGHGDPLEAESVQALESHAIPLGRAVFWLLAVVGIAGVIASMPSLASPAPAWSALRIPARAQPLG